MLIDVIVNMVTMHITTKNVHRLAQGGLFYLGQSFTVLQLISVVMKKSLQEWLWVLLLMFQEVIALDSDEEEADDDYEDAAEQFNAMETADDLCFTEDNMPKRLEPLSKLPLHWNAYVNDNHPFGQEIYVCR